MDIRVTDRETVENGLLGRAPFALISITDPDLPPASVPAQIMMRGMLRLSFDDAQPADEPLGGAERLRLMCEADAEAVWRFVVRYAPEVCRLVVHCEAGWSRSPAVAAAIAHEMRDDATIFFRDFHPNPFVFRTVLAATPRDLLRRQKQWQRRG